MNKNVDICNYKASQVVENENLGVFVCKEEKDEA